MVARPPSLFNARSLVLEVGSELHRVHRDGRSAVAFNPGRGERTRFAPFGQPRVPTAYFASTARVAVAETILHDIPGQPSPIIVHDFIGFALSTIHLTSPLRLANLTGIEARVLGIHATELSAASDYSQTVAWAEAAHAAGFDGLAYISSRLNADRAYVLFGDRSAAAISSADDTEPLAAQGRAFSILVDLGTLAGIDILPF